MRPDFYHFPAVFSFEEDGISVEFPDLPGCLTCAHNEKQAFDRAQEALGLYLYDSEVSGEEIPAPSSLCTVEADDSSRVVGIMVYMPAIRSAARAESGSSALAAV